MGIGKRLKVGGIDAAPGVDEETTVTPDVRQAHEASKAARQTQVETSRKLREEARAVPPEVAAGAVQERIAGLIANVDHQTVEAALGHASPCSTRCTRPR